MTRGEILKAATEAIGRRVSFHEFLYARELKVITPTIRRTDNWFEYSDDDLKKFVAHLKSKPRRPQRQQAAAQ